MVESFRSIDREESFTAEALRPQIREFLMEKYSELRELCIFVVNIFYGKTWND